MAIIKTFDNGENTLNYVGTLSFFCVISCTIIMLKFRGFKATFNISSKNKKNNIVNYDESPGVSLTGAYRTNKDELFDNIHYQNPPKTITPAMVSLPAAQSGHRKDISKSTNNLAQPQIGKNDKTKSTPNIPVVVPEPLTKTQIKEAKKLEKNLLDEKKKQSKMAAKEQEKAEKNRKERDKLKLIMKAKAEETKAKRIASQVQPKTENKTSQVQAMNATSSRPERQEPTNSVESINNSSGPPPYTPTKGGITKTSDQSDNIWDMVSQHRQQVNRPQVVSSLPKQTHLDLNYNVGPKNYVDVIDNSDA